MGFFDKLLKGGAKNLVSNMVDKAVDGVKENKQINKVFQVNPNLQAKGEKGLRARFEQVVAANFPLYELKKEVASLDPEAVKYSYALYLNGKVGAYVNVISDRNLYKKPAYRKAKEAAVNSGVPHMNFFSHMPNEMDYITKRLKENGLV